MIKEITEQKMPRRSSEIKCKGEGRGGRKRGK
jgi:hypothetical protein